MDLRLFNEHIGIQVKDVQLAQAFVHTFSLIMYPRANLQCKSVIKKV